MTQTLRFFGVAAAATAVLCACSLLSFAQPDTAAVHQYIGAAKCKMCHSAEKIGGQYPKWKESKHAQAYATLATPAAKEAGAKAGVDDPQNSPKCLKCHVTGYGVPAEQLGEKYDKTDGVTCEACHGAGGDYWKKQVMEDLTNKKIDPASVGLLLPDEKRCVTCHNPESPSYKEFKFDEFSKQIAHPMPKQ